MPTTITLSPATRDDLSDDTAYPDAPNAYPDYMYPDGGPGGLTAADRDSLTLSPA